MKERLRELGIRNTELSQYMRISRPSLYKYLGLYESGDKKNIPENVLRCFKFIDKHKNLSKEQIISYVLYEFSDTQASDRKEALRQYLMNNSENDQKIRLMYLLISSDIFDPLVPYLVTAAELTESGTLSEEQIYQVSKLMNFISDVTRNTPVSEEELKIATEMLENKKNDS